MHNKIKTALGAIGGMILFGPIRSYRIFRLSAQKAAEFRKVHGREPTEAEWAEIAERVEEEA